MPSPSNPSNSPAVNSQSQVEFTKSDQQSQPKLHDQSALITLRDHFVTGVSEGSLSDLQFRPNASFHPIREIDLKTDQCELIFDRPIRGIDRPIKADELLLMIQNIKRGERDLALGQDLFLYPGKEAFCLSQHGELRILLRNIRPKLTYHDCGQERLSLIAFLALIEEHSPRLWDSVAPRRHQLENLNQLEELLQGSTLIKRVSRALWRLCLYALFLWLITIPIAAFGPPKIREPLKELYHPVFERLADLMSPVKTELPPKEQVPLKGQSNSPEQKASTTDAGPADGEGLK